MADESDESLTVRCRENRDVWVRVGGAEPTGDGRVLFDVELGAPGLAARADGVMAWEGRAGVGSFLGELLADFRGWEGRRVWETDDRDLAVAAEFRSGGLVGLTWTVRPWRAAEGGWAAEVTTWVEAGAQLSGVAGELERMLS